MKTKIGALCVAALVLAIVPSAYGSSSGGGTTRSSTTTTRSARASGGATSRGVASATALVKKFEGEQPLQVSPVTKKPATGKTIGFVNCNSPTCVSDVAPALKKLGWSMKVYQYSVSAGPQNMAADIGSALQASPDYLGISAIYPLPTYLTELAAAKSKNVPVASLAGANSSSFIGCFSCDAATDQEGVLTAATAISDSRGKGNTLIVTDPTIVPLQQIVTGIKQEFARADPSAPLNVLDVSLLQAPAQNSSTVISYLQAHPQVRYVIFPAPPVYTGLFPQLKSAGLLSHLTTIAAAISPADLPLIKSGELSAGVAAETDINTWRMVDAFVHEAVHEPLPAKFADPAGWARIITKSDATPSSLDPTNWRQTFYSAWKVG